MQRTGFPLRWIAAIALVLAVPVTATRAAVTVSFDLASLNEVLSATAAQRVKVPLAEGRSLDVELHDLKVTGLDPAGCGQGCILTAVQLRVPQLGLSMPLQPRLTLAVVEGGQVELRFQEVKLPVPLVGTIDVGSMLRPMRFEASGVFQLPGGRTDVQLRSRLSKVQMVQDAMRLSFDIDTQAKP